MRWMWLLCGSLCVAVSHASLPVVDFASVEGLLRNYHILKNQYDTLLASKKAMLQQVSELGGHYGYGAMLDDRASFDQRNWSPDTWRKTLQGLAGGDPVRYQQLVKAYKSDHRWLDTDAFKRSSNAVLAKRYTHDIAVNQASSVNASFAFNTIKQHLQHIHQLANTIDQAPNTKAAIDLNSRLLAELAYIHTQELKMQVLLNQQIANQSSDQLSDKTEAAVFNAIDQG